MLVMVILKYLALPVVQCTMHNEKGRVNFLNSTSISLSCKVVVRAN